MQWLKDRWLTVREAFVVREVLALPVVVTAITLAAAGFAVIARYVADWGIEGLIGIPRWAVVTFAAVILTLVFMTEYANRLRSSLTPKIFLSFDPDQSGIAVTPARVQSLDSQGRITEQLIDAAYIRIHVELLSKATLRDCPAFIEAISKRADEWGAPQPITLHNPIGLGEVTVRPKIKSHVDFLICKSSDNHLEVVGAWPLSLRHAFDDPSIYRFKLTVIAADVPKSIEVDVHWKGKWDTITGRHVTN